MPVIDFKYDESNDICSQPTTVGCINGEKCSPVFSLSQIGDYCRNQYKRLSSSDRDTYIENFCLRNEDIKECKCVNRSLNPDYQKLKLGNPYSDACWYIPCTDRMRYFAQSDFDKPLQCPKNICQIVYDIAKVNDVDIDNIKNDINCDLSNGGVIPDSSSLPSWIYIAGIVVFAAFILVYSLKKR